MEGRLDDSGARDSSMHYVNIAGFAMLLVSRSMHLSIKQQYRLPGHGQRQMRNPKVKNSDQSILALTRYLLRG